MLHLARAYDYAQSISSGFDANVQSAIADFEIFQQLCQPTITNGQVILNENEHSTSRALWHYYVNELAKVIQFNRPVRQIYQVYVTLHAHLIKSVADWLVYLKYYKKTHFLLIRRSRKQSNIESWFISSEISGEIFHNVAQLIQNLFDAQLLDQKIIRSVVTQGTAYVRQWATANTHEKKEADKYRTQINQVSKKDAVFHELHDITGYCIRLIL
jgi:hypothetical protein